MVKRIISIVLVAVLVLGVLSMVAVEAFGVTQYVTSDACVDIIKQNEGFCAKPIWDYAQYTVGYGTRCPDDMLAYYKEHGITEAEAVTLLRNHLAAVEKEINEKLIVKYNKELTQNQFDALVSFSYNCGTGWLYHPEYTFTKAILNGETGAELIRCFALWCSAGGEVLTYLLNRRLSEANIYLNGVYAKDPPENYCYVLYNANGGSTDPRTQGYSVEYGSAPYPVPVYAGHTFAGWYTARTGGTKVEKLDASHHGTTLYAHWIDAEGEDVKQNGLPVTVTVTGQDVNVRKGPGTNYTSIRKAQKGEKLTITEVQEGGRYSWGNFGTGWIALQYTDYETVIHQKPVVDPTEPSVPETTVPESTVPETTVPETTVPEPTVPETTQPKPTEPKPTEPEPTEPEIDTGKNTLTGTVKVNEFLRVRSGPSTGYKEVTRLKPNQKVEILETKTVGSVVWGRISSGWISLDYVVLDKQQTGNAGTADAIKVTIVNCTKLRIRTGPGTNYSIAGYINAGTTVSITEQKKVGTVTWGKFEKGWISFDYVKINTGSTSGGNTGSTTTTTSVTGTVKVNDFLRIRNGPGTSYAVAGYMKPNEKVTITEQKKVGSTVWGKTSKGWISMDYVVLDKQNSSSGNTSAAVTKTITATCLNVRKAAGTSNAIVGYLYKGAKVTILETKVVSGVTWGRISNGWISMEYVK